MQTLGDKYRLKPEFINAIDGRQLSGEIVAIISSKNQTVKNIELIL